MPSIIPNLIKQALEIKLIEMTQEEALKIIENEIFKYEAIYNELPEEMKQDGNFLEKLIQIKPFLIGKINRDLDCFKKCTVSCVFFVIPSSSVNTKEFFQLTNR